MILRQKVGQHKGTGSKEKYVLLAQDFRAYANFQLMRHEVLE